LTRNPEAVAQLRIVYSGTRRIAVKHRADQREIVGDVDTEPRP
jgi:hypothetical protein